MNRTLVLPGRWWTLFIAALTILALGQGNAIVDVAPSLALYGSGVVVPSAFHTQDPVRVMDTRTGLGGSRRLWAGSTVELDLTGTVADDATAVTLTVTITGTGGPGFLTVWPTGGARPVVSSVNATHAGHTIANLVTVPLGEGHRVSFYGQTALDLVVDLAGTYRPTLGSHAGRFETTSFRVLDTRDADDPTHPGALRPGERVTIDDGIDPYFIQHEAVVVNVTVVDSPVGYWTVWPSGSPRPTTSNLNVDTTGATTASLAVVKVTDTSFSAFSQNGGHLVIDVVGYYTGPLMPYSNTGLYVPLAPHRLLDTRNAGNRPGRQSFVGFDTGSFGDTGYATDDVAAIDGNATITDAAGPGFFAVNPRGVGYEPYTSNLNANVAGDTVANHVISMVMDGGVEFLTQNGAHLIFDATGFFLKGGYLPEPPPPPLKPVGTPPTTGAHSFWNTRLDGYGQRWDPCTEITYRVNVSSDPGGHLAEVQAAVAKVAEATGLRFRYLGESTETVVWPLTGEEDYMMLLGFRADTPMLENGYLHSGYDYLTRAKFLLMESWYANGAHADTLDAALLHIVGHAVGLFHVDDHTQIMGDINDLPTGGTYGDGDREGLWWLGSQAWPDCRRTGG